MGLFFRKSIRLGKGFRQKLDKRSRPSGQPTEEPREAPQWQPEPQLRQRQQVPVGRRVIGLASVGTAFIFFVRMFGLPAGPALPNGNLAAPVIQAAPQREPIHHAPARAIPAATRIEPIRFAPTAKQSDADKQPHAIIPAVVPQPKDLPPVTPKVDREAESQKRFHGLLSNARTLIRAHIYPPG